MAATYDGIIIGAGVIGSSAAMHLASAGLKNLLVLEKAPGAGFGSTGKSSACIRQTYSHYEACLMAFEALQLFKNWQEFTGLKETRADFRRCGILFLMAADDPSGSEVLRIHRKVGVVSSPLDERERQDLYPDLDFCSILLDLRAEEHECRPGLQVFHEAEGGYADPVGATQDMLEVARQLGTEIKFNTRVTNVLQQGGRVTGIEATRQGGKETYHAPLVINCAGPWAMALNTVAEAPLKQKMVATRNQIVCTRHPEKLKGELPVVADMVNGLYFRSDPTGRQILVGSVKEEEEREAIPDPDHYNEIADGPFREEKLTHLHHRVPVLRKRGEITSYAGLYTINQDDYYPVIDESELEGFYPVCGFSGHGFKLAPIVGTILTQKVLGQWGRGPSAVPLNFFNRDRKPLKNLWGGVVA